MDGKQYKQLITEQGLMQKFVSKKIGVHYITLNNFLNNKSQMREYNINKLDQLLGIQK